MVRPIKQDRKKTPREFTCATIHRATRDDLEFIKEETGQSIYRILGRLVTAERKAVEAAKQAQSAN